MYSLPTLSSLYLKLKKTWMKRFPTRSLTYWGILAAKAANKQKSRRLSRRWHSLTKTGMRWYCYLTWVSCFSTHFNRGNPTLSPGIQHGGRASHWGRSPVYRSSAEVQAWLSSKYMTTLYNYKERLKQTSNKRVHPHEIQEKDFVPKKGTTFPTGLQGQVDAWLWRPICDDFYNCGWWQTCTSSEGQCSQEILCQKKKSSISRKRRLRQKWASRWTENPKGRSKQKLETKKIYI